MGYFVRFTLGMTALTFIQLLLGYLIYPEGPMYFLGATFIICLWLVFALDHKRHIRQKG